MTDYTSILPLTEHTPIKLLVTGGAGFIGSNFVRYWLSRYPQDSIINLDALTYSGNRSSLAEFEGNPNYTFVHGSITDPSLVDSLMSSVDWVVHFAAETHVDRSIADPATFVQTNTVGTQVLLTAALRHKIKRFHHISTDEVFGSLQLGSAELFTEKTPYDPRSPYSASKAGSDHLVRAAGETFGLPYTITNCSNNYGPYMFPEKFIPLAITNILEGKDIPIYGPGNQVRDWLHVVDHCRAIELILFKASEHSTYLVGGVTEDITNLEVAQKICTLMDKDPSATIKHVTDRPGHDERYAIDWTKIKTELGWEPSVSFEEGLRETVVWYTANKSWWQPLKEKQKAYFQTQYGK